MSFKRSPSKVWWGNESFEFREVSSSSPGSQDSGFSDAEGSPQNGKVNKKQINNENVQNLTQIIRSTTTPSNATAKLKIPKNIFKDNPNENLNFSTNYKEKSTPIKENIDQRLVKTDQKNINTISAKPPLSEPSSMRQRYTKNYSPKVNRNLFMKKNAEEKSSNQYSKLTLSHSQRPTSNEEEEVIFNSTNSEISGTKSLPLLELDKFQLTPKLAKSLVEEYNEALNSSSSECDDDDSELGQIFEEFIHVPKHTSTPKFTESLQMRYHRRNRLSMRSNSSKLHEETILINSRRVPPNNFLDELIKVDNNNNNSAVLHWINEIQLSIEQECTTSLQCKSIAAELNQKVDHFAACSTTILRGLLSHCKCIEMDFNHLKSGTTPNSSNSFYLIQSLATSILEFYKIYTNGVKSDIKKLYDDIIQSSSADSASDSGLKLLENLYEKWNTVQIDVRTKEIKKMIGKLEDPTSEMDLRATLTGITSVALRNSDLIEYFIKADIIPILLILCERCEGSSLRTLILRALSTMCTKSMALQPFEKFSGIQMISDIIQEESHPEPERSEAVALLAQVTAPWMDDNHAIIKSLHLYAKKLIKHLTKFASTTKCCQNLLLSTAALANFSSLEQQSIKYLLRYETATILLQAAKSRGPLVSIYLLEQIATLLANMATAEVAREQFKESEAAAALIYFLRSTNKGMQNEEVERRLQQKTVIALSRLCGDAEISRQVVNCGGIAKLVQLCREKEERFCSDAVLVATLATLRKITEACGKEVMNEEDCQEFVEPKLLDSFLAYSSQNESYV